MKRFLQKLLLILAFSSFLTSCFDIPNEPIMPNWDVNLNVPLLTKRIEMIEILDPEESEFIGLYDSTSANDSLYFLFVDNIENSSAISDSIIINPAQVPTNLNLLSNAVGDTVSTGIVFNPDPDFHLVSAVFRSGAFSLQITNNAANPTYFEIVIPGFKDVSGNNMVISDNIPALTTRSYTRQLTNYDYNELDVYEGFPLVEPYEYQNAEGFLVVLKAEALTAVDLSLQINNQRSSVERLEGRIKRISLGSISQMIETGLKSDIEDFRSSIRLRDAELTLNAETMGEISNIAVVFEDMKITGFSVDENDQISDSTKLLFNGSESFVDSMIAGVPYEVSFNQDNTNVTDFFLDFPARIRIDNRISVAPVVGTTQIISANDSIKIAASITAPVVIAAKEASYDSEADIELDENDKDALRDLVSAYVKAEIKNRMPLAVSARVAFVDASDNELFVLTDSDGNELLDIAGAPVDENGVANSEAITLLNLTINQLELNQLIDNSAKAKISMFAKTTGGSPTEFGPFVQLRANDYIEYTLSAGIVYHIDPEAGEE